MSFGEKLVTVMQMWTRLRIEELILSCTDYDLFFFIEMNQNVLSAQSRTFFK